MSDRLIVECNDLLETQRLGKRLADAVENGLVIALIGNLGAGKTTFVRSVAEGLGIDISNVNSPTFVLLQLYSGGKIPIAHFDAYRVGTAEEFQAIGADEYLFSPLWLSIVEWADIVEETLPVDRLAVRISASSETGRCFEFEATGPNSRAVLSRLTTRND